MIAPDASDLAFPATTNPSKLAEVAKGKDAGQFMVVFATYHSLHKVSEAQLVHGLPEFDLAICDEAHRTAGKGDEDQPEKQFSLIHNQEHIRTRRRLYMTATPKVYYKDAKDRAKEEGLELYSMEDRDTYGSVLYEIGFGDAVNRELLSDYKVIVLTIPEEGVEFTMRSLLASNNLRLDDVGKLIGCWRALAKVDREQFGDDDISPMRRAIAYTTLIRRSKHLAENLASVTEEYRKSRPESEAVYTKYALVAEHVDGGHQAMERAKRLEWLEQVEPEGDVCHVLSNVRCLSEGVDVPALDAIIFMEPRRSGIEVVQAVGRVMRRSKGKRMGYVIIPVLVRAGEDTGKVFKKKGQFEVVWEVLNAIRSHDKGFEHELNMLALGNPSKHLEIISLRDWYPSPDARDGDIFGDGDEDVIDPLVVVQPEIDFGKVHEAIRVSIVKNCGNRKYWEDWGDDVADIAQKYIVRIQGMVGHNEVHEEIFNRFLAELRDDLNEGITREQAIEMLAQHMVTAPVFKALLGSAQFVEENPISKAMQTMFEVLEPEHMSAELEGLEEFYEGVFLRAETASASKGATQKLLTELYERFFRKAFPKSATKRGAVYTPVEIVDFILNSVDALLRDEFGESLSSEGVGILDPFTGTGTFITRMIQNGLINSEVLERKYHSDIHANEITLLSYYIATVNIEQAYHEVMEPDEYERFLGIILTDTFDMQYREDEIAELMQDNSEQRKRQKEAEILAIVGNPPWRVGQRSANDAAQKQPYPKLKTRVKNTYGHYSKRGGGNALGDAYVFGIRWASDRIGNKGVIGFVTNGRWVDGGSGLAGMRKCLEEEFTSIYVLDLRGNTRMQGELVKKEGGKVFGSGSRAKVVIVLLVKNPNKTGCTIHYRDIGDYLTREEKLRMVKDFGGMENVEWRKIDPNERCEWINQGHKDFYGFPSLGAKGSKKNPAPEERLFKNYSLGVTTNRDAWCYNYSENDLRDNIGRMIRFFNMDQERCFREKADRGVEGESVLDFINRDPKKIKWSDGLERKMLENMKLDIEDGQIIMSYYRPFMKMYMYFGRNLNGSVSQMPQIFPHDKAKNRLICVMGSERDIFSCMMVDKMSNRHFIKSSQCFPRWLYRKEDGDSAIFSENHQGDSCGYMKRSAFTDWAQSTFQKIGGGRCQTMTSFAISMVSSISPLTEKNTRTISKTILHVSPSRKMQISSGCFQMWDANWGTCT